VAGHVFVSYSREDRGYVDQLAEHLRTARVPCWYDYDLAAGDTFWAEVQKAIDECAVFLIVITPQAVASPYVRKEIHYAELRGKPIWPIELRPADPLIELANLQVEAVTNGAMPSERFIGRLRRSCAVRDERPAVVPFYFVCEESARMAGEPIDALNKAFPEFVSELAMSPVLSDQARFCLIGFADQADVLVPLCDLGSLSSVPALRAHGEAHYEPAFTLLREQIYTDIGDLKSDGYLVYRPVVFFLTGSQPADAVKWPNAYRKLTDPEWTGHPNVFAFGFGQADGVTMQLISTVRAFMADGTVGPAEAVHAFADHMVRSMIASTVITPASGTIVMPVMPEGVSEFIH
jgi:uncharacterized protein YegL